ncbi:MAG: PAS domain S-box protein [Methanosarcina sp.]
MPKRKAYLAEYGRHSSTALETKNLELAEIIDIKAIQPLMANFYKLTHIPIGLNDLKGNVLIYIGWQDICTKFHRANPEVNRHCIESTKKLVLGLVPGEFKLYKCQKNMWHIGTPIMVAGRQIGGIFGGQFFFEDESIDYEFYRAQARKYGFNEEEYIAALEKVPHLSREAVDTGMSFLVTFANMISQLSYSNINMAKLLKERESLVNALTNSEKSERARSDELAAVLDAVPAAVFITRDPDALNITGNRLSYKWLRLPEGTNASKSAPEGERPETYKMLKNGVEVRLEDMPVRKSAKGIEVQNYEFDLFYPDNTMRHLLGNARPLYDEQGYPRGAVSTFIDITERKKMEEALRLSSFYNRSLIEASVDPLFTIGMDGKITDVNTSMEFVTGFSREELNGTDFTNYFTEPEKARKVYQKVFKKGFVSDYALEIQHKKGKITPVLYNASVFKGKSGEVIGVFAAARNITRLKKAEEKIQRLASIVESSDDAILTLSLEGTVLSWNKGAVQIYGYAAKEILGKKISILEPNGLKGEIKYFSEKIRQGEKTQKYETLRLKKDGTTIDVSVTLSPIYNASGQIVAISAIARDITEKKIAEKLLQEKQLAEVANHTKSEFLANMSHELRTPLNSIIGFSDLLYEQAYGPLNERQLKSVGNISKSGKYLLNLINDILDLSKIEAGKIELNYKSFELAAKLNTIRNILFPIAHKKNVEIEIEIDEGLTSIYADEDKFVRIMYNLVDNAIKFSYENSSVKIEARKKEDKLEITVKDAGAGIKLEDQYKLFKPFSQIYSFSSKKAQGTGLGLSLVKQIVHLHHGYVWFKSKPGEGSTFAFAIPINGKSSYKQEGGRE